MNERNQQLRIVSNRLFWSLAGLVAVGVPGALLDYYSKVRLVVTPAAVLFVGFIGGFVGLQRRLKTLPPDDLALLADSWVCTALSPVAGAILAELVYLLFISGMLAGNLFPVFAPDNHAAGTVFEFRNIFQVHCATPSDYAKVLFWSFVAGFSEKFVTNIISQFDASGSGKPQSQSETKSDPEVSAEERELPPGNTQPNRDDVMMTNLPGK
jgi:hypothetical protein